MWIFTQTGFISAVRDFNSQSNFLVRGRDMQSLASIAARFGVGIVKTPTADYPYRVVLREDQLAQYLGEQVYDSHYFNFKSRVLQTRGPEFEAALMNVWRDMRSVEDDDARSHGEKTSMETPRSSEMATKSSGGADRASESVTVVVRRLNEYIEGLSERQQVIFEDRLLTDATTLDAIGARFSVTRERIRQLEKQLVDDLCLMGVDQLYRALLQSLFTHGLNVDSWMRHVDDLPSEFLMTSSSEASLSALDLLSALRKVELRDHWIHAPGMRGQVEESLLNEWLANTAPLDEVVAALATLGLVEGQARAWLDEMGVTVIQGRVHAEARTVADFIFQTLTAAGAPVATARILELSQGRWTEGTLRNRLLDDPRFVRVDRNHWALAGDGVVEYQNVKQALSDLINQRGPISLAEAKYLLAPKCDVEPESVEHYARQHPFLVIDGVVQLAPEEGIPAGRLSELSEQVRAALIRVSDGHQVSIKVNREHLRGSGYPLPRAVPSLLGMRAGEDVTLPILGTGFTYAVSWFGQQATGSSLRRMLNVLEAREGDIIKVTFLGQEGAIIGVRMTLASS